MVSVALAGNAEVKRRTISRDSMHATTNRSQCGEGDLDMLRLGSRWSLVSTSNDRAISHLDRWFIIKTCSYSNLQSLFRKVSEQSATPCYAKYRSQLA